MSNFVASAFHPKTGKLEQASWCDNHFGQHEYGVLFPGDPEYYPSWQCERAGDKAMAEIERLRGLIDDHLLWFEDEHDGDSMENIEEQLDKLAAGLE